VGEQEIVSVERVKELLQREAEAVLNIPVNGDFDAAVDLIHRQVHERGGKLVTGGMGKAGEIAQNIATTFSSTGTPAVFLRPAEAQHGDLGVIQPDDVLLLISNSGKTREVLELVELSKHLYPQMPLVVITGHPESGLARAAEVALMTGNPAEVCPLGLSPTTSTTVMTVIGDALIVLMMEKIGFTSEDYARRHHGGYLGGKSREQAGR
jgi:arabinose-5-phosphate isomerase